MSMFNQAEIKRRKQQSARDKRRHHEEQEEKKRRKQQSLRDKARNRSEQARLLTYSSWALRSFERHIQALPSAANTVTRSSVTVSPVLETAIAHLDVMVRVHYWDVLCFITHDQHRTRTVQTSAVNLANVLRSEKHLSNMGRALMSVTGCLTSRNTLTSV